MIREVCKDFIQVEASRVGCTMEKEQKEGSERLWAKQVWRRIQWVWENTDSEWVRARGRPQLASLRASAPIKADRTGYREVCTFYNADLVEFCLFITERVTGSISLPTRPATAFVLYPWPQLTRWLNPTLGLAPATAPWVPCWTWARNCTPGVGFPSVCDIAPCHPGHLSPMPLYHLASFVYLSHGCSFLHRLSACQLWRLLSPFLPLYA